MVVDGGEADGGTASSAWYWGAIINVVRALGWCMPSACLSITHNQHRCIPPSQPDNTWHLHGSLAVSNAQAGCIAINLGTVRVGTHQDPAVAVPGVVQPPLTDARPAKG